mgnify:CR=1 FL=1
MCKFLWQNLLDCDVMTRWCNHIFWFMIIFVLKYISWQNDYFEIRCYITNWWKHKIIRIRFFLLDSLMNIDEVVVTIFLLIKSLINIYLNNWLWNFKKVKSDDKIDENRVERRCVYKSLIINECNMLVILLHELSLFTL